MRRWRCSITSKCFITSGGGIRRSARSVRRPMNVAHTKRAWTLWKTAKNAVSHSAHTHHLSLRKKNEDQKKHRSYPVHRIGSGPTEHGQGLCPRACKFVS